MTNYEPEYPDLTEIPLGDFTDEQESDFFRLFDLIWGVSPDNRRITGVNVDASTGEVIIWAGVYNSSYMFSTLFDHQGSTDLLMDAINLALAARERDLAQQQQQWDRAQAARRAVISSDALLASLPNRNPVPYTTPPVSPADAAALYQRTMDAFNGSVM